jgi:hypothetical protein
MKLIFLFLLILISFNLPAQNFQWARQGGGTEYDYGYAIASDPSGNTYVTGYFTGTGTFGSFTLVSTGLADIFIVKYDQSGNVIWAKKGGSTNNDYGRGITVDGAGNIYITGNFSGTAGFGSLNITSAGGDDIFIVKYNSSGNEIWAARAGSTGSDFGTGICVNNSGHLFLTGNFTGTASFGIINLISAGAADIFIARYDSTGKPRWARRSGGNSGDGSYGAGCDASGNTYITGQFQGTADFGLFNLTSYSGSVDAFTSKYDTDGNIIWVKQGGGTGTDFGNAINADRAGNVFVTGQYAGSASFGGINLTGIGGNEMFVVKYNTNGDVQWAKMAGGTGFDYGVGIATDNQGASYVTGNYSSTAAFGPFNLTSAGGTDIFIAKYDASGNIQWARSAGGPISDFGIGITIDSTGRNYITGGFFSTAVFGTFSLTSAGGYEAYIASISSTVSISNEFTAVPVFELEQNYPNPFNPDTYIRYSISESKNIKLVIYDISGKEIRTLVNGFQNAGTYSITFNGNGLASGIYYYKISAGEFTDVRSMVFIK